MSHYPSIRVRFFYASFLTNEVKVETTKIAQIRSMLLEGKSTPEIFAAVPGTKRQGIHNLRYRMKRELSVLALEKTQNIEEKKLPTTVKKKFKPRKKYVAKVAKTDSTKHEVTSEAPKAEEKKNFVHPWDALHDLIQTWGLGFYAGNVVKHVVRHRVKYGYDDLKEAKYNLDRLIDLYERGELA